MKQDCTETFCIIWSPLLDLEQKSCVKQFLYYSDLAGMVLLILPGFIK